MKLQNSNIEFIEHNKLFENSPSNFLEKLKTKNNKSINANETFDSDEALQFWGKIGKNYTLPLRIAFGCRSSKKNTKISQNKSNIVFPNPLLTTC